MRLGDTQAPVSSDVTLRKKLEGTGSLVSAFLVQEKSLAAGGIRPANACQTFKTAEKKKVEVKGLLRWLSTAMTRFFASSELDANMIM